MEDRTRRQFIQAGVAGAAALGLGLARSARGQEKGERPRREPSVETLNPRGRAPVSLIIDDSTCLVNMARFAMPQFAAAWPNDKNYQKPWRQLPREIPDAFVRKFGEWCAERGVKGKYSIVPYPSCVGWLDRDLPGWSAGELRDSLKLVRELMLPNWDIHPEMVSHTRVIDTKTGRPYPDPGPEFMENWRWTDGKSVDELTDYLAYALRILKNVELPCEGITTPGGFGNRVLPELAQATLESCRDVFQAEIPHYFRHLFTDKRSVAPRVEYASGLGGADPRCVVSIVGCTGDWFGGWDGMNPGSADKFITEDLKTGRMVDVIASGEPAVMVCHWPGIYFNGEELGFKIFQEVVRRLHARYDRLLWMKLSEISRYWAARELTRIERRGADVVLNAPFACPEFTLAIANAPDSAPALRKADKEIKLGRVASAKALKRFTWTREGERTLVCFDLPKGESRLTF